MPLPTPAQLDLQASAMRSHAAAMHRTYADHVERDQRVFGTQVDANQRAAAAARASAADATTRATEMHGNSRTMTDFAKDLEDRAAKLSAENVAEGRHPESEPVQEWREQAQGLRAAAAGQTHRAEQSEQAAREQLDQALHHDREADRINRAMSDRSAPYDEMERVVDTLEDRIGALERAAQQLRAADNQIDPAQRQALPAKAQETLAGARVDQFRAGQLRQRELGPQDGLVTSPSQVEANLPSADLSGGYESDYEPDSYAAEEPPETEPVDDMAMEA